MVFKLQYFVNRIFVKNPFTMEMKYACLFVMPAMLTFFTFKKGIPDEPPVSSHVREVQCSVQNLRTGEAWSKPFSYAAFLFAPLPQSTRYVPPLLL
jgi:hypothetical protein